MKLSNLIDYNITIDNLSFDDITDLINARVQQMLLDFENNGDKPEIDDDIKVLKDSMDQLLGSVAATNYQLGQIKNKLKEHRVKLEKDALIQSYNIYDWGQHRESKSQYILDRHNERNMVDDPDALSYYIKRIHHYSAWRHPAVLIRPLNGEVLSAMIANDPLYILDEANVLLQPSRELFTPEYQNRLRYKTFNENSKPFILNSLIPNQIGLFVVNEFFNVRPFEIIKEYLSEIFELLKPGGIAIITFNNGDIPQSTRNFEAGALCYTPASLLIPLAESYDFEVLKHVDTEINFSWLEIKKPGELTSLRGGQALTEIK